MISLLRSHQLRSDKSSDEIYYSCFAVAMAFDILNFLDPLFLEIHSLASDSSGSNLTRLVES